MERGHEDIVIVEQEDCEAICPAGGPLSPEGPLGAEKTDRDFTLEPMTTTMILSSMLDSDYEMETDLRFRIVRRDVK